MATETELLNELKSTCSQRVGYLRWFNTTLNEYESGTVNLCKFGGSFYLTTCYHVAEGFFSGSEERHAFIADATISEENLRMIAYSKDDDAAIIRIEMDLDFESYYTESDLGESDLSTIEPINNLLYFRGFPSELPVTPIDRIIPNLKDVGDVYRKNHIWFEYRHTYTSLPHPGGLSGAFILALPKTALLGDINKTLKIIAYITGEDRDTLAGKTVGNIRKLLECHIL